MNLDDDESYLSAYLDDELEPADRLSLELALEADPALRDRLHALTRGRDALLRLSRPTIPVDLTSAVLARLPSVRTGVRSTRLYRTSLWVATAATVLVAIGLTFRGEFAAKPPGAGRLPAFAVNGPLLDRRSVEVENPALIPSSHSPSTPPASTTADLNAKNGLPSDLTLKQRNGEPIGESPADRDRFLALIDRSDLRRVMIPIDTVGGDPTSKIERIVQDSPRRDADYFRLTLMQGLVIDPTFPNKAELFVVVVTEAEREHLVKSLSKSFADLTEGNFPGSEVPALLADAGEVKVFPGRPAAGLVDPPPSSNKAFATMTPAGTSADRVDDEADDMIERPDSNPNSTGKIVSKDRRPNAEGGSSKSPKGASRPVRPDGKITLVIWVTKRGPAD